MTDLLSIGSSGINVYQRALSTVSNNIANLNTEGYSRQTTEIRQNQPQEVGKGFIGTGAYFDRVSRQYDSFLESSLQQATADLESQGAAVEYANRLLDVLGDEKIGLTGALNKFFSAAKSLSTDPASPALRGIMLRESEALASRFQGLAGQLDDLGEQSLSALEADVRSVNALTAQIAEVNRQMLKKSSALDQAPELLDRRDQLLRDLSEYAQIRTSFDARGSVTVSLSESATKGRVVSGTKFSELAVEPSTANPDQLTYRLQGELSNELLTGIPSGSVSGYARFYEETLVDVRSNLNALTRVLVDEVNAIQTNGLNGEGDLGEPLFEIVPRFDIDRGATSGDVDVQIAINDPASYQPESVTIAYDGTQSRWYSTDASTGQVIFANSQGLLELDDLTIQVTGQAAVGDQLTLIPDTSAARGIELALSDGIEIATASLFRVTPSQTNGSVFDPKANFSAPQSVDSAMRDLSDFETGRAVDISASTSKPLTVVPAGTSEVSFTLNPDAGASTSLQIMTREGQHLVGHVGTRQSRENMVGSLPAFSVGSQYDDTYLNDSGLDGYKDFELFYGRRVEAEAVTELLPLNGLFFEAPFGTDFKGGGLDLTLEPSAPTDRLGIRNSAFVDPTLGEVSAVNDVLYLGQGGSAVELGTLETTYNGAAQTLRIRFSDAIGEGVVTDELAARVATLVTYDNGTDLTNTNNRVNKSLTSELFTADFSVNLALSTDFDSADMVASGQRVEDSRRFASVLTTREIDYVSGAGRVLIEAGDLSLNGVELGELQISDSGVLSARDVKTWLDSAQTDLLISAQNRIEIAADSIQLDAGAGIQINGISAPSLVTGSTTRFDSTEDLVASINAITDQTQVFARLLDNGSVVIQNNDLGGDNIVIGGASAGAGGNALGISSKAYIGHVALSLESGNGDPIEFELGDSGRPADLNLLGLDTEIRLSGQIDEELLVFADGGGEAALTATSVANGQTIADGLRSRQFEFEFYAADRYRIRDLTTDTVVSEREYSGELALQYQGIEIALDNPATLGDSFVVDGNNLGPGGAFDAQGNNANILRMVDLESRGVLDGGLTLTEGYLRFVGDVGNMATQSEIARDALQIVQTQAVEARDRVSGVNLDKEAADLIRFQQAYQASAQVMQVATQLFDTMLQIR